MRHERYDVNTLGQFVGQELGVSDWHTVYGLDRVRFIAPVKAGARIRNRVVLVAIDPQGKGRLLLKTQNTVEIEGETKPALIAEALVLLLTEL